MIPSSTPRAGLEAPSATRGDNGSDPVNGREWDTQKADLEYACTFDLPTSIACQVDTHCDCGASEINPPLCSQSPSVRIKGKGYPTDRPLRVVRGLGNRAVFGSICASNYESTMNRLLDRLSPRLAH
jgi:hypothetical protein